MAAPPNASPQRPWPDALLEWVGGRWRGALVLVAVVFALFGASIGHRATLDSMHFLGNDPRVRECRVGELLTTGYWNQDPDDPAQQVGGGDLYRPLTLLWMAVLWQGAGAQERAELQPMLLNAANVGLHALSVVLRFWLFLALLSGGVALAGGALRSATAPPERRHAGAIAFFAALLLAVHPIATEAVATQVGAAEGLAVVCSSAALLSWHRWQVRGSWRHAAHFAVWLLLALLAKENAVATAAIAPVGTWLLLRRSWRDGVVVAAVAALPILVWVALRFLVSGAVAAVKDPVLAGFPPAASLQMALAAIGWYDVPALVWPFHLLAFVGHQTLWPPAGFGDPRVLAGIAAVIAFCIALPLLLRRSRVAAFGLALFALAFFPVSNLVVPIGALAATRFLYLPMTGLALAAAVGAAWLVGRPQPLLRRTGIAAIVVPPVLFALATLREVPVWRSEVALQRAMAERAPDSMFTSGLASALLPEIGAATASGDTARVTSLQAEAMRNFEAALAAPRPTIPGTSAVPEDVLELLYKTGMNLAISAATWHGDLAAASAHAATIREIAQTGARQSAAVHGQANWVPLESDAECMLSEFSVRAAQRAPAGSAARAELLARAEQHIARARQLAPDGLRADEQHLQVVAVRGDADELAREFAATHARVRPQIARLSAAVRIALAYSQFLERQGQTERALAIALDTVVNAANRFGEPSGFLTYGARGIDSKNPEIRQLARRALQLFIERADVRDSANIARARRLLGQRGP